MTQGDIAIPCGRNPDGNFHDCVGASGRFRDVGTGKRLYGELSSSDSRSEPAYGATAGYDLATGT